MAQTNKNLRMFIRMDGSGRAVPGSGVLRLKKPKVGKWFEIPTYECCDPLYITDTTTTTSTTSTTTTAP
jgi:hypothetical protein